MQHGLLNLWDQKPAPTQAQEDLSGESSKKKAEPRERFGHVVDMGQELRPLDPCALP